MKLVAGKKMELKEEEKGLYYKGEFLGFENERENSCFEDGKKRRNFAKMTKKKEKKAY